MRLLTGADTTAIRAAERVTRVHTVPPSYVEQPEPSILLDDPTRDWDTVGFARTLHQSQ